MRPTGDHFYTTSAPERDNAIATYGYVDEGIVGYVPVGTTVLFRMLKPDNGDHFYTTSLEERDTAISSHGYVHEGIACAVFAGAEPGTTPLFRMWNPGNGDHFYTTSAPERDIAVAAHGYTDEGVACHVFATAGAGRAAFYRTWKRYGAQVRLHLKVVQDYLSEGVAGHVPSPGTGTVPLFRMWNPSNGDHFYTTSAPERDTAVAAHGYTDEGVACHVFPALSAGTVPLFRMWNPGNGDHFYTTSAPERDIAVAVHGYTDEGVACYVFAAPATGTVPLFRLWNPGNGDHFYTTSSAERDTAVGNVGPAVALNTMVQSMQQVFDGVAIRVVVGSQQNLGGLGHLLDVDVGGCTLGTTTAEQNELFGHRDNVQANEVTVYLVRTTVPAFNGCASHPAGRPGAVVAAGATRWTLAHEVGHVLGLLHLSNEVCPPNGAAPTRLMTGCGTATIAGVPTLVQAEANTMDASALTVDL